MSRRQASIPRSTRPTAAVLLPLAATALLGASLTACGSSGSSAAHAAPAPAATTSATATAAAGPRTFALVEHDTAVVYTPKGGRPSPGGPTASPAPGDRLDVTADFLRDGTKAGTGHYTNDFRAGNMIEFDGVISLSDGQLVGHGLVPFSEPTVVPVVSGTGAYAGLTGTITAAGTGAGEAKLTVVLK